MDDSILISIKDAVSVPVDETEFDGELLMHINSAFFILNQLGVGPEKPFIVDSDSQTWTDFMDTMDELSLVKTYIQLKVRVLFDPPTSSQLMTSINEQIKEYEWRLNIDQDKYKIDEGDANG